VNKCAVVDGTPAHLCWCNFVEVPVELLKLYNPEDGCICKECVEEYWRNR